MIEGQRQWWAEAIRRFTEQENANANERRRMEIRHASESDEMYRRHEREDNPFQVALGDHYTPENVDELAAMIRLVRKSRQSKGVRGNE